MLRLAKRDLIGLVILALGSLVLVTINLWWVHLETRPPHWDMARHLWTSLQYLEIAKYQHVSSLVGAYYYYPPLIYWVAATFYVLFGVSVSTAVAANQVFLVAGIAAVYLLGRRMSGAPWGGLLAALVFATSPLVATQFKEFQIDGPLAAVTAVWLLCLVESDWFERRNWSLALGVATGLGLLCKWTFVLVIALPLAAAVGVALWRFWQERRPGRLINLAAAGLLAAVIAPPWYYPHAHQLKIDAAANNAPQAKLEGDPTGLSPAALTYYAKDLLEIQLYLPVLILFAIGSVWALRERRRELLLPGLLLVGTYVVFSAGVSNKDPRYTLPLLPAVAVLAVWWIPRLAPVWRRWVAGLVVLVTALTFWAISFGLPVLPAQIVAGPTVLWAQHGYIISRPSHENWHLESSMRVAAGSTLAYSGPDTIWFNSWGIMYYAAKYKVQLDPSSGEATKYLLVRGTSQETRAGYDAIKHYGLPDGGVLTLYERTP